MNMNSQNLTTRSVSCRWTSTTDLLGIFNTLSKRYSKLNFIYDRSLFLKTLWDEIFCGSWALCRNVTQKIPTRALNTGKATGKKPFNGPCVMMILVEGSFSCPTSPDCLSALLALDIKLLYCEQAHTKHKVLSLALPKHGCKRIFTSGF